MKIRVKKISPLQAGKMLAAFYALFSLIFVPIMVLVSLLGPKENGLPMFFAILFPLVYIIVGFIGGIIGAFIYNLVAGWIGGMEITFEEEKA